MQTRLLELELVVRERVLVGTVHQGLVRLVTGSCHKLYSPVQQDGSLAEGPTRVVAKDLDFRTEYKQSQ